MQFMHHKFMLLLVFALGLVVCMAGTAYAANPWQTAVSVVPVTYSLRHRPAAGAVHQANATVEVHNNFYSPASVTIKVGETVTWTHVEGFHNVLANDVSFRLGEAPNGAPGTSWLTASHTFTQTGTFKYHCEVHGLGMSGEVIVQANDDPITSVVAINNGPTLLHNATSFTATVTGGTNVSYTWNFGDGKSGTGITTTHSYTPTGAYTVTVTATNSKGSQTASTVVQITNKIVQVADFSFTPSSVTVNVGDRVTWVRKQGFHNVDANDSSFRLGEASTNNPGSTWTTVSHQFTKAGTITYHCDQHSFMTGTVIVQASSSSTQASYLPFVLK